MKKEEQVRTYCSFGRSNPSAASDLRGAHIEHPQARELLCSAAVRQSVNDTPHQQREVVDTNNNRSYCSVPWATSVLRLYCPAGTRPLPSASLHCWRFHLLLLYPPFAARSRLSGHLYIYHLVFITMYNIFALSKSEMNKQHRVSRLLLSSIPARISGQIMEAK